MIISKRLGLDKSKTPVIGVLAIQGSFELHLGVLRRNGIACKKVRYPEELSDIQGLIIPGGESTVIMGVGRETGLFDNLRDRVADGLAILGTCAGAIILGQGGEFPDRFGLVPVNLFRNAYGRQFESFEKQLSLRPFNDPFQTIFIRAPKIILPENHEEKGIDVLGWDGENPVFLQYKRILLATFHPELTEDGRIHQYFLEKVVLNRD